MAIHVGLRYDSGAIVTASLFPPVTVMLTKKPQAISGVSPKSESVIEELYPSMATTGLGQLLHGLYESIPVGIGNIKLSHLLFVPPTIPFALLLYFGLKVFGSKYVVTNRAVKIGPAMGLKIDNEVTLDRVTSVSVDPDSRLAFFRSGDVRLTGSAGDTLMLLRGVPYPDRFAQVITEAVQAQQMVSSSLNTIRNRK
ncbi:MAG TPA: hypothetical protein VFG20_02575 [Planctomycetaceae bacterium]|nr:hypothetical protein [Planctomycetaceae bacterium]